MTPRANLADTIRGLRNLEKGYSLAYAVDYYAREEGVNVLALLAELEADRDRLADALRLVPEPDLDLPMAYKDAWDAARAALDRHAEGRT